MGFITKGNNLIEYEYEGIDKIVVPNNIKVICKNAFSGCDKITDIILPDGINKLEKNSFWHCDSLENINLPDSIISIGRSAFEFCHSLKTITLPSNLKKLNGGMFYCCTRLENVIFNNGLRKIENDIFINCFSLKNITIPDSVIQIGVDLFVNCDNLENVNIPSYDVFKMMDDIDKIFALNSLIKKYYQNKDKFNDNQINEVKEYIKSYKEDILELIIPTPELIHFMLHEIDNLFTKEELYELLEKIKNTEAKVKILNYLRPNKSIEQIIDDELNLDNEKGLRRI